MLGRNNTIVKVDFTEYNDITKHHNIAIITIWRTSAIKVTALSKTHFQKWKVCKKISIMGVRDRQKNRSLRITVCHHSASLVMPDSNVWDIFFYLPLTPMTDFYNQQLCNITSFKKNRYIFRRGNSQLSLSEKGSTLKGKKTNKKHTLPLGANSFLLE